MAVREVRGWCGAGVERHKFGSVVFVRRCNRVCLWSRYVGQFVVVSFNEDGLGIARGL